MADKNFKRGSAEILSDLLSEKTLKQGLEYLRGEEFKTDRERLRREAAQRLEEIRDRYRARRRTPETAAREREISLRLAEVEAEAAELRLRLAELLEEEERLRAELDAR
ncbi:MAG: hypothetical protein AB1425_02935 [Actinomycetota bacterium]